jgi:hypothetical protein
MFKFCIGILTFIQVMTLIKWTFKISQPCSTWQSIQIAINLKWNRCNIIHLINGLESKYNLSLKFNDKIQMLCWKISYTVYMSDVNYMLFSCSKVLKLCRRLFFNISHTQFIIVGDIYPESCKVYHRGYDCVSYNQHPSRWKLRRSGVNEVIFGYSRDFPFQLTNITQKFC